MSTRGAQTPQPDPPPGTTGNDAPSVVPGPPGAPADAGGAGGSGPPGGAGGAGGAGAGNAGPGVASQLRRLRSRFASGIVVVACRTPAGLRGVTVSSFAAVSLAPPLVLFCIDRELESEAQLRASGGYGISILSDHQELLAQRFAAAAPLMDDAFTGAPDFQRETGAPLLDGAVAWLDCRPEALHGGGDHTIFVARVVWAAENPRQPLPLITFSRHYADLANLRRP